jgi:hypothetical protein
VITDHPFALLFIVVTISGCLTALTPFSGFRSFLKNLTIGIIGLSVLMYLAAMVGRTLHDFLLER